MKVNARSVYDLYDGDSDASSSVGTPIKRLHAEQSWVDLNETDSDVEFAGSPVCSLSGPHMENQTLQPKDKIWIHFDDGSTSTEHVISSEVNIEDQQQRFMELKGKLNL